MSQAVESYRLVDTEPTFYDMQIVIRFLVTYLRQLVLVTLQDFHCRRQYRSEEI